MPDGAERWTVVDGGGDVVVPAEAFLAHLQALGRSPTMARAYAFSVQSWFESLGLAGLAWDDAKPST